MLYWTETNLCTTSASLCLWGFQMLWFWKPSGSWILSAQTSYQRSFNQTKNTTWPRAAPQHSLLRLIYLIYLFVSCSMAKSLSEVQNEFSAITQPHVSNMKVWACWSDDLLTNIRKVSGDFKETNTFGHWDNVSLSFGSVVRIKRFHRTLLQTTETYNSC